MVNLLRAITLSLFSTTTLNAVGEEGFVPLFDGKTLTGWNSARNDGKDDLGEFTVNEKEKSIHCYAGKDQGSKQKHDCLVTEKQFSYFILMLEYKWSGNRFAPRADWDRDAGLLFHVHGNLKKIWPHSLEMQIGESPGNKMPMNRRFHSGDLFVLGGHLRAKVARDGKYHDPKGKLVAGRSVPTRLGKEKPTGEWNEIEIHVHGSEKATFIFNGEVVLELTDIEQKNKDGKYVPLTKGHIGIQAEWAEILYRNIRIKELKKDSEDSSKEAK